MSTRPSVLLIREVASDLGGCCRIPQSSLAFGTEDPAFAERRQIVDRMGAVYQALTERFGRAIDLEVVDPRNFALPVLLLRDLFAFHVGLRDGLRTLARISVHMVVVNGRIVDDTDAPDARAIVDLVARLGVSAQ